LFVFSCDDSPIGPSLDICGVLDGNGYVDEICGSCSVNLWGECYEIQTTTVLSLDGNQLTGEIPPDIGQLINLTILNLSFNLLTGTIPSEIGNLKNLEELILEANHLSEMPEEICNQGDSAPFLGFNRLCPPYPSCISQSDIDTQNTLYCP